MNSLQPTTIDAISEHEQYRLSDLETIIEHGLSTFQDVGQALAEIRDRRLYRATHGTFEDYCKERWGFTGRFANYQIQAAQVVKNLGTMVPILPVAERQVRPLIGLDPDSQRKAWLKAIETAPNGKITAAHVEQVVGELKAELSFDEPHRRTKFHDRTPTMHGGLVIYWTMLKRRWTTAEWAEYLGLTTQGAARILNNLAAEHDFSFAPDQEGRWTIYINGEPF